MKVAMPVADGKICPHFGHCRKFAFLEVDEDAGSILKKYSEDAPLHQPGLLPLWLKEREVDLVIAGGMGSRAQGLFFENGIKVVVGAPAEDPVTVLDAYLNGSLQTTENLCDH